MPNEAAQVAQNVRAALGYGSADYLAAVGTNERYQEMIAAGIAYVGATETPASDLMDLISAEHAEAVKIAEALAWDQTADGSLNELLAARDAIRVASADALHTLLDTVGEAHQSDVASVVSTNLNLDSDLRALVLTAEQRSAILDSQWERDSMIRNPMNWYQKDPLNAAHQAFDEALQAILTPEQLDELEVHRQLIHDRMVEIATLDLQSLTVDAEE